MVNPFPVNNYIGVSYFFDRKEEKNMIKMETLFTVFTMSLCKDGLNHHFQLSKVYN